MVVLPTFRLLAGLRNLNQLARTRAGNTLGVAPAGQTSLGTDATSRPREQGARLVAAAREQPAAASASASASDIELLRQLESKANWLSCLTVHDANNVRPKRDGLKVGGHQSSSASLSTILTVLYARVLAPQDRVAVKPHAAPLYHALQYMMGRQTLDNLKGFRALGGAQAYPSRTKDLPQVDFSTGSVGMGVGVTVFAALAQTYLKSRGLAPKSWPGTTEAPTTAGRMVSIVGDAELDEGIVFEALLESWKHDVSDAWCIVDYNRQSLDQNVRDGSQRMAERLFRLAGWCARDARRARMVCLACGRLRARGSRACERAPRLTLHAV
jgi:pyruvate dehydrogenase E1 component